MKITKSQLKQIIKEEMENTIIELETVDQTNTPPDQVANQVLSHIKKALRPVDEAFDASMNLPDGTVGDQVNRYLRQAYTALLEANKMLQRSK